MKQPNVSNDISFAVDSLLGSKFHVVSKSVESLSQDKHQLPDRTDLEAINSWSRVYDLPGGMPPVLGSLKNERGKDTLTARAVEDAIVAERNPLARELHDAVTQTLFTANLIAEVLPDLWDTDEVKARKWTDELRQLTRGALAEM